MDSADWAAHNLIVIRTLMERAAVYRRALAPVMLLTGTVGILAAAVALALHVDTPRSFIAFWLVTSLVPVIGGLLLVRRQALHEEEPFWSLPTRRVTEAALPALAAGLLASVVLWWHLDSAPAELAPVASVIGMLWTPVGWIILYGCALHAAGFYMRRGIKLFGWIFIASGVGLLAAGIPDIPRMWYAHGIMGTFFGALHLAYGVYLYFTEARGGAL